MARQTRTRIEQRLGIPFNLADSSVDATAGRLPLLVIHDREDSVVPHSEGEHLVENWPGARLMSTGGLGHHCILRDPEVMRSAVRFLDACGMSGTA